MAAYVVVVHLSEEHESVLAQILEASASIPATQVTGTVEVVFNHIYVIPPGQHLEMVDGCIHLAKPQRFIGQRVPIDRFFRTLAGAYGKEAFAIILSGAGSDGSQGLPRVKEEGGYVLVQDPGEADYDSMPMSAIATGMADVILPVAKLPAKLLAIRELRDEAGPLTELEDREETALAEVLALLRTRTGHDFTNYKRPTLSRRIARRLHVNEIRRIADYPQVLRTNPEEADRLLADLLISVTNFFRDKEAFDELEQTVIPQLFADKSGEDTVRVWSCGCATGEEAFTLAILLHDYRATLDDPPGIQILGSDISEDAIRKARKCQYSEAISTDVNPERLARFFTKKGGVYVVNKELRDSILFAPHNVLRDPPFSNLDLVVCRNLLIYLNRETQTRLMETFGFALRPGGYLFLGASEGAENSSNLFVVVSKKQRIYRSLNASPKVASKLPQIGNTWDIKTVPIKDSGTRSHRSFAAIHSAAVDQFAPPSILVNEDYDIVHVSVDAGRFLQFPAGSPSRNLLKTGLPGLQLDLRAALITVQQDDRPVEVRNVKLGEGSEISLRIRPIKVEDADERFYLIIFEEEAQGSREEGTEAVFAALGGDAALEAIVRRLENELQQTRERLRATIELGETSNEELKASNEELQAINEELRSASEELETSKEELHSVNEELTTVNQDLKDKIDEISQVNSDLYNLVHATDIGTIFLDRNLCIKRYTRRVEDLFNIIASDVGRPVSHLTHRLEYTGLVEDARSVLTRLNTVEHEVRAGKGEWYIVRLSPYRTTEDHIDGVVGSFIEVSAMHAVADSLREREALLKVAQRAAKAGTWVLDLADGSAWWSSECAALRGVEPGSVPMSSAHWIEGFHPRQEAEVEAAIMCAFETGVDYTMESEIVLPTGETRWLMEVGRPVFEGDGNEKRIAGITLDVTERANLVSELSEQLELIRQSGCALETSNRRKDEFLATLAHELRNPLAPICTGLDLLEKAGSTKEFTLSMTIIRRQISQIIHLVDDLLDVSRITYGKIRLRKERMRVVDAVRSAIESCLPVLEAYGHSPEVTLPAEELYLHADFTRVIQILVNLLNNAAKFTPRGGSISVIVARDGAQAKITVKDTGVGLNPESMDDIFNVFTQAENDSGQHNGGLGLGLSLVRNLTEMHGGKVTAASEGKGKGAEFTVSLPLVHGDEIIASEAAETGPDLSRRILIVDDNVDAADLLDVLLCSFGHTTAVAHTGQEAIAEASTFRPEVVLLDIGLPDMTGYDLARALRRTLPGITLIAISGWGQESDRERSREAGIDHHLVKPATAEQIHRAMREPRRTK